MEKAMKAGIEFYISKNNVVLSSGINGVIAPEFF
jgi:2'-phosphotransferase